MNYYEIFRVANGIELVVHGAFEEVHYWVTEEQLSEFKERWKKR